ncbi:putative molybdate ABC transporter [Afipia carboxidovorans OM5]|uniref:Transmembrane protein n=1 Tax=Afipia carboxidovorans (strain ATCC 49405 / DSM 1227 / KCTC 32145 / OM5) TaxID=504832 RepID=B6JAM7_AFIC5|nr:hypothetical protein [Afipia carboxidovorans]ACI91396.1 putative molybdate ABC transporter [Afipia carboxidovorans OM5]AEI01424.1 hypothetical protein OCA4_c02690 [Afipia carboxidovorans OM4]AEI04999.1 hypothetical protein OCA5_c02700 [Afipia carboxidovorans OM5]
MPAVLGLLFIVVPFLAASVLEFEGFIALALLFCVVAGLAGSSQKGGSDTAARLRQRHQAMVRDEALRAQATARPQTADRLPDLSRV